MDEFDKVLRNMNSDQWERFSVEVLRQIGFDIITYPAYGQDGGQDYLVEKNNKRYLVSCKHYTTSNIGLKQELNIVDRLVQFKANGFIGFYLSNITTSLQNKLNELDTHICGPFCYCIFTQTEIKRIAQEMDSHILHSFGLQPKYYLNVSKDDYLPLLCPFCHRDMLAEENIPSSLVSFARCKDILAAQPYPNSLISFANGKDDSFSYIYGCNYCLNPIPFPYGYDTLEMLLHIEIQIDWFRLIDSFIRENNLKLADNFYFIKDHLVQRIAQRLYPQTAGSWAGLPLKFFD